MASDDTNGHLMSLVCDDDDLEVDMLVKEMMEGATARNEIIHNADGSIRKVNRVDYSRGIKREKAENPWRSCSYLILLTNPATADPRTRSGKEFRAKFRTPYPVFLKIVEMARATGEHDLQNNPPIAGVVGIPLELKILMVLRTLGCAVLMAESAELAGYMSTTTANTFFKTFNRLFVKHYSGTCIKPLEGEALDRSMKVYAMLGLPLCVGSIDAVFVPWEMSPISVKNLNKGDKGQGVLFQVVVDHCKKVLAVEGPYHTTWNDKNTVKYSSFIDDLKTHKIYNNLSYKIKTGPGENDFIELSTCYVICDGGYLEWEVTICAYGPSGVPTEYKFTDWIASVRKDVECFFGILKQRFRFFKNPCTLHNEEDVGNAFRVACMINNLILESDGLDRLWEDNVNWKRLNPDGDGDEDQVDDDDDASYVPTHHDPTTFTPTYVEALLDPNKRSDKEKFHKMRDLLANHLQLMYRSGNLRWPKTRTVIRKENQTREQRQLQHHLINELPRQQFPSAGDVDD